MVALAVFSTLTAGLPKGLAIGICVLIPSAALSKFKNDERQCMQPVRDENEIFDKYL